MHAEHPHETRSDPTGRRRAVALEADRAERALRRHYPALARALGPRDVARLGRELVQSRPFSLGSGIDFVALWPDFLAASLDDHTLHGPWLCELARFEESLAGAGRDDGGAPTLRCEHRVDEVHSELLGGGAWLAPRPAQVVFAFERERDGVRAHLRRDCEPPTALPRSA
jgi:hypothetical protein